MNTLPQYIQDKIIPEPNSGCWIWCAGTFSNGYGAIKIKGKILKAHRFIYETLKQKVPPDLCACHKCDNTYCVNPDHIFIGTHKQNGEDKSKKGRAAKGIRNGNSKLTEEIVLQIWKEKGSIRDLGKKYGLAHSTIRVIKAGLIWGHITNPHGQVASR